MKRSAANSFFGSNALKVGSNYQLDNTVQIDGRKLREETDRILRDETFKDYLKLIGTNGVMQIASTDPYKFVNYGNVVEEAKNAETRFEFEKAQQQKQQQKQQEQRQLAEENKAQEQKKSREEELTARKNEILDPRNKEAQKAWYNSLNKEQKEQAKELKRNKDAVGFAQMVDETLRAQMQKQDRQAQQPAQENDATLQRWMPTALTA